eukprot:756-Pelagococcus_subviridis.AAC.1
MVVSQSRSHARSSPTGRRPHFGPTPDSRSSVFALSCRPSSVRNFCARRRIARLRSSRRRARSSRAWSDGRTDGGCEGGGANLV